jgi:hypothetical protein
MPPTPGTIHRRPRRDSGAARMWEWARHRRRAWSIAELAEAVGGCGDGRGREIVRAWRDAGLVDQVSERERLPDGTWSPALYRVPTTHRDRPAPVMPRAEAGGLLTRQGAPEATVRLRSMLDTIGMSTSEAARALDIDRRALGLMLTGDIPIADDDPVLAGLQAIAEQRLRTLRRIL